jgi:hypothetical protein
MLRTFAFNTESQSPAGWVASFANATLAAMVWLGVGVLAEAAAQDILLGEPEPEASIESLAERLESAEAAIASLREENERLTESYDSVAESLDDFKEADEETQWYDKIQLRGYAQFRYNHVTHFDPGSAPAQHASDSSIEENNEFLIRRARLIFYGDITDHLYVYVQPDFAANTDGSTDNIHFAQLRDWYGDVYLDEEKVHRFRVGQSKIPYGWENLQSSQNRLPLDRGDSFNSAARNERDLGVFYYWTPEGAQDLFKYIQDENLKGSGNYGVFGFGAYNGQGGSLRELNDELHLISRLAIPYQFDNGQIIESGIQGYTGRYVVGSAAIAPLGVGPAAVPTGTRNQPAGADEGILDQRLGVNFVHYPQPLGVYAEWTVGRGPELNAEQTAVERASLQGGQVQLYYRYVSQCNGEFWPFMRWQHYRGGYKSAANAPAAEIDEWSLGLEWQIRKEMEFVTEYLITDRTNTRAFSTGESYNQFVGDVLRFQFQLNF